MRSGCFNKTKKCWCVCLGGGKRGSLCGTKAMLGLHNLEQGNQVRAVVPRT